MTATTDFSGSEPKGAAPTAAQTRYNARDVLVGDLDDGTVKQAVRVGDQR